MDFELVIKNGTVIDGTGSPRFRADIGISKARIAAIASEVALAGRTTMDATGMIVAPGFVDIHSHLDWDLVHPEHQKIQAPIVLQGITTVITGNCGFSPAPVTDLSVRLMGGRIFLSDQLETVSWRSVREYLDLIEREGVLLNVALLVGHNTVRYGVMGERADGDGSTPEEIEAMCNLVRQGMREGAYGFSTGVAYMPGMYASSEELQALLQVTAEAGGTYATHLRSYSAVAPLYHLMVMGEPHNILAVREQIELARRTGVQLQLAHLLFHGRRTWPTYRTVLRDVERAVEEGLDVAFDSYAQTYGNTTIKMNFPNWFLADFARNIDDPRALRRAKTEMALRSESIGRGYRDIVLMSGAAAELAELERLNFGTIAERLGMEEFEAYAHAARASGGKAFIRQYTFSGEADGEKEEPLRAVISHRLCAINTDASVPAPGKGQVNPAAYGTYPRLLGRYSRDLKLFSLEEIVRRMTWFPAERLGLVDIGRVVVGQWADLVLFDPETVNDHTTLDRPDAPPEGIEAVLISGRVVARNGQMVSQQRHGRVLRR